MIQDRIISRAVSGILHRSERQDSLDKIVKTFVDDVGIVDQINNNNNQIVYGRRGTGKTHIFKYLESNLNVEGNIVVYIDTRTLGSTSQFGNQSISISERCLLLFRDILGEIYTPIMEYIFAYSTPKSEDALTTLDQLARVVTEVKTTHVEKELKVMKKNNTLESDSGGLTLSKEPKFYLDTGTQITHEDVKERKYETISEDKVLFPEINHLISGILQLMEARLYVLIDEWSALPNELQPYLSEFLKRGFFANSRVVVKIAALEYRSNFGFRKDKDIIGFELGSDISTSLDIDDYYVFDRNPRIVTDTFREMLYRHLINELPENYLKEQYYIDNSSQLIGYLFTSDASFQELVRASEGVARDLINMFSLAVTDSIRKGRHKIEKNSVLEAARQWFETDKSLNLNNYLHSVLRKIVDEVIGVKKARSFLVPRDLEKHPIIQELFDARVLHIMKKGYADKENPGIRYNIYTLDYGTYVDLINTANKPDINFGESDEATPELVVPFDDKRSIRRIILTQEVLNTN